MFLCHQHLQSCLWWLAMGMAGRTTGWTPAFSAAFNLLSSDKDGLSFKMTRYDEVEAAGLCSGAELSAVVLTSQ